MRLTCHSVPHHLSWTLKTPCLVKIPNIPDDSYMNYTSSVVLKSALFPIYLSKDEIEVRTMVDPYSRNDPKLQELMKVNQLQIDCNTTPSLIFFTSFGIFKLRRSMRASTCNNTSQLSVTVVIYGCIYTWH